MKKALITGITGQDGSYLAESADGIKKVIFFKNVIVAGAIVENSESMANKKGFTLLEVLVSLAIMAIAVTLLLQLFSADLRAVSRAGDMTWASVKADAGIKKILDELSPVAASWSEVTEDGYRMDVSITEVLMERTDNLPFKLMEVSLTVGWTEGRKEKSLGLKTLKMVDRMAPAEGRHGRSP